MYHAKKMPGGTSSMMSGRKTLRSMMNPQPMQFTMGAKMYQNGQKSPMMKPMPQQQEPMSGRKDPEKVLNAMGRLLKQYLKGGKSDAGLKALAESNPNLTYKEAMNGMRLIKDPVGMKSAGEGRKMYRHGGAHNSDGSPVQNPFDRVAGDEYDQAMADIKERGMIRRGDASSATPGEGVTLAFGEGSPVDFQTVQKRLREKNPDLFNPRKKFYQVGDERVFLDEDVSDEEFDRLVLQPANEMVGGRRVGQTQGETYSAVFNDLMSEFDNYVAGFGDEVKNDPEKIQKMRDEFAKEARNLAGQIFESRGN